MADNEVRVEGPQACHGIGKGKKETEEMERGEKGEIFIGLYHCLTLNH